MDIRLEWISALKAWAANNGNVAELWLFGSRAKDTARPDSDIDVAVVLMPPTGKHNWALANFVQGFDDWKAQLRDAVDWPVSLISIGADSELDGEVRATGVCLFRRQ